MGHGGRLAGGGGGTWLPHTRLRSRPVDALQDASVALVLNLHEWYNNNNS